MTRFGPFWGRFRGADLPPLELVPPTKKERNRYHGPVADPARSETLDALGDGDGELRLSARLARDLKGFATSAWEAWQAFHCKCHSELQEIADRNGRFNEIHVENPLAELGDSRDIRLGFLESEGTRLELERGRIQNAFADAASGMLVVIDTKDPGKVVLEAIKPRSAGAHAASLKVTLGEFGAEEPLRTPTAYVLKALSGTFIGIMLFGVAGIVHPTNLANDRWFAVLFSVGVGWAIATKVATAMFNVWKLAREAIELGESHFRVAGKHLAALAASAGVCAVEAWVEAKGLSARAETLASATFDGKPQEIHLGQMLMVGLMVSGALCLYASVSGYCAPSEAARNRVAGAQALEAAEITTRERERPETKAAFAAANRLIAIESQLARNAKLREDALADYERRRKAIESLRRSESLTLGDRESRILHQLLVELRGMTGDYVRYLRALVERIEGKLRPKRRFPSWLRRIMFWRRD